MSSHVNHVIHNTGLGRGMGFFAFLYGKYTKKKGEVALNQRLVRGVERGDTVGAHTHAHKKERKGVPKASCG